MTTILTPQYKCLYFATDKNGEKYQFICLNEISPTYVILVKLDNINVKHEGYIENGTFTGYSGSVVINFATITQKKSEKLPKLKLSPGKAFELVCNGKVVNIFICVEGTKIKFDHPIPCNDDCTIDPETHIISDKYPCLLGEYQVKEIFNNECFGSYSCKTSYDSKYPLEANKRIIFSVSTVNEYPVLIVSNGTYYYMDENFDVYKANRPCTSKFMKGCGSHTMEYDINNKLGSLTEVRHLVCLKPGKKYRAIINNKSTEFTVDEENSSLIHVSDNVSYFSEYHDLYPTVTNEFRTPNGKVTRYYPRNKEGIMYSIIDLQSS